MLLKAARRRFKNPAAQGFFYKGEMTYEYQGEVTGDPGGGREAD